MVTFSRQAPSEAPGEAEYKKLHEDVIAREKVIKTEWLEKTKDIYAIYEGGKQSEAPFNILYSNTEILVPNLFSAVPKTIVSRRFGENRADEVSQAAERMAEYSMDTNLSGYPDFVEAIEGVVMDSALPGQGQARVRIAGGKALVDYVQHDKFIWGYAQRWEDTPWVSFRSDKTKADIIRELELTPEEALKLAPNGNGAGDSPENKDKAPPTIALYETWNKSRRTVCFTSSEFEGHLIREIPDPLQLEGFYPCGKPLRLLSTPTSTMPKALYGLYRQQAEELNNVTWRIKRLVQAIQVRGVFDGTFPEMEQLFASGDAENMLIPASNPGVMSREGGLDRHIWLIPVEKLIQVLSELYNVRDKIKSVIYEIMGIGDILRGVSAASETLGAQQIKDKWGTLRIRKSRERVNVFIRQLIRLLIEASAKHVPEEDWAKITGLPYLPTVQAQIMRQQQAQTPPQPGMPPPPPIISWGDVLQQLKDDMGRSYLIDIETNSTVDATATEDKQEVTEFMGALSQATAGLEGIASAGPEGFEVSKAILTEICKRFRLGNHLDKLVAKMQPPPQGASPEQQKKDEELKTREEQVKSNEQGVQDAANGLKTQQLQQTEQLNQLMQQLTAKQQDLKELQSTIEGQKKEFALEQQAFELQKREAALELKTQAQEAGQSLQEKDLSLQAKDVQLQSKESETKGVVKENDTLNASLQGILESLAAQTEATKTLLETISKPLTITKTGPGTYTRSHSKG